MTPQMITTPPRLPVRRTAHPVLEPPKPPLLPGMKPVKPGTVGAPRPPSAGLSKPAETREQEIARRQKALAGSGVADPKSTIELVTTGAKNTAKAFPILIKKYWWLALIIGGLWLFLMTFDAGTWGNQHPGMRGFFNAIKPVADFLVFLTAAYNNWIAKSVLVLVVLKVGVPLFRRIKAEGFGKVMESFQSVGPGLKKNWAETGPLAVSLFVVALGVGLALSNFLSGNNSYTRYLASLALALSMVKTLSEGNKAMTFTASRVVSKDVFKLFGQHSPVRNHHIYLGAGGVMTGLAGAAIPALLFFFGVAGVRMSPLYENICYVMGGAVVVIGAGVYFAKAYQSKKVAAEIVSDGGEKK